MITVSHSIALNKLYTYLVKWVLVNSSDEPLKAKEAFLLIQY